MNLPITQFRSILAVLAALLVTACASPLHRAPVEDRTPVIHANGDKPTAPVEVPVAPPPGVENAGKPGYYTVKPGDTLIRISLETGQNWRDLVKWNDLVNPNLVEVGQVLRVVPPTADGVTTKPVSTARVEARPLDAKPPVPASAPASAVPPVVPAASTPPLPPPPREGSDDDLSWLWPAAGPVVGNFEEGKRKGLMVSGKAGDPVYAAADGHVVYAGSAMRGYGNLIIIKHNATYLTAYAHNQTLLVKEDQAVKRGQKIAEMGSTDSDRVGLHFEIRRQGRPVDPLKLLPQR
ncbi:MAG: LysM peptidoglycan-binding domain-containing protein [Aquabacterium sp.]|jgi:lipoprotein NlpD|nr:MAG: LysM peptidoglycan-binding domain-containing protein [Aquabacterium sp.]